MTLMERNRVAEEHIPLAFRVASLMYHRYGLHRAMSLEDIRATALMVLVTALHRYQAERGADLRQYLQYKIRAGLIDEARKCPEYNRYRANFTLVCSIEPQHALPVDDDIAGQCLVGEIWSVVERLPSQVRAVLRMLYRDGLSQTDVALRLRLSKGRIRQIKQKGIAQLRSVLRVAA